MSVDQNDRWLKVWEDGNTKFHIDDVHPFIKKYVSYLVNDDPVNTPQRILIPLCGKSVDMLFLHKMGLTVIGIELSPIACHAFFNENNLTYQTKICCGFNIYKHDERLIIFQGDLFKATIDIIGGACDLHWDRGSFVALPQTMQSDYAKQITSLLKDDSKSLMECFEYDTNIRQPPPNSIPFHRVKAAFGEGFIYKEICRVQSDDLVGLSHKLDDVTHVLYFLSRN